MQTTDSFVRRAANTVTKAIKEEHPKRKYKSHHNKDTNNIEVTYIGQRVGWDKDHRGFLVPVYA